MYEHGSLPRARHESLLEERVGEELLLYDQESHTAHCLSPIAACVWRHCDGEHDLTGLAEVAGASESLVAAALRELREKDLLATEPQLTESTVLGESRREAIGRAARYGAAAAAGSMIISATAATPAMAQSEVENFCCECLTVTKTPCACTVTESTGTLAGNEAKCTKFCKEAVTDKRCSTMGESLVKGGFCVENTNKCSSG
jgi:hypothetical protein